MSEHPFTILIVCTGNICRSPIAQQLLRERLRLAAPNGHFRVASAGTDALVDSAMTPQSVDQAQRYGVAENDHRARALTPQLIAEADLVLTATRRHRGDVVTLLPSATRYTFTLNEFARLLASDGVVQESPQTPTLTFLSRIARSRGQLPPPSNPAHDDIEDPYRRSQDVYDEAGAAIDYATRVIATALAAQPRLARTTGDA